MGVEGGRSARFYRHGLLMFPRLVPRILEDAAGSVKDLVDQITSDAHSPAIHRITTSSSSILA